MSRAALVLAPLVFFLLGIGWIEAGPAPETPSRAEVRQGQELFQRLGCRACHALEGQGGTLGPALNRVGRRLSATDLEQQLTTPGRRQPHSRMPSFAFLRPEELKALVSYLITLR